MTKKLILWVLIGGMNFASGLGLVCHARQTENDVMELDQRAPDSGHLASGLNIIPTPLLAELNHYIFCLMAEADEGPIALRNMQILSAVCKDWYQLAQDRQILGILINNCLAHLPQEYLVILGYDQPTPFLIPSQMNIDNLLTNLWADQAEECGMLVESFNKFNNYSFYGKEEWKQHLDKLKKIFGNFTPQQSSLHKLAKIVYAEKLLNLINNRIVKMPSYASSTIAYELSYANCITRIPAEGMNFIIKYIEKESLYITNLCIYISGNKLHWLPDALFDIPKLTKIELDTNCLRYIPQSINKARTTLTYLNIGNSFQVKHNAFNKEGMSFEKLNSSYIGNKFGTFPLCLLELDQLKILKLDNLGLKELPAEIYEKLPHLIRLVVKGNTELIDLPIVPEGRQIDIVHSPKTGSSTPSWKKWLKGLWTNHDG